MQTDAKIPERTVKAGASLAKAELEKLYAARTVVRRAAKAKHASEDLISFAEMMLPDVENPEDVLLTRYRAQHFHRAMAEALESVERGENLRVIITMPPRHGKSQLAAKFFPAWFVGKDPTRHVMIASYNQPFVEQEYGKQVRDYMASRIYGEIFPKAKLKDGSQAVDRLQTEHNGIMSFVGRGGSITGRGAHLLIIDDPLKNSEEANSELIRDQLWSWYQNDVYSRLMNERAAIIIIQTRWHEDDLVGRLTDPDNPHYNEEEAAHWKIINIPALCEEPDFLGRMPGDALWPEIFSAETLQKMQRKNPLGFAALYQQHPSPLDGNLFTSDMIVPYKRNQQPRREMLRIYAVSDHAIREKQHNDRTCILILGIDEHDNIWVLKAWWQRAKADVVVKQMIDFMLEWKPILWFTEKDHITNAIGPFLRKEMRRRNAAVAIKEATAHGRDKVQKAAPLMGIMAQQRVLLPEYEPWFERARAELLKFPTATHDDFVDALGLIGRWLGSAYAGKKTQEPKPAINTQTFGYMKKMTARGAHNGASLAARQGF